MKTKIDLSQLQVIKSNKFENFVTLEVLWKTLEIPLLVLRPEIKNSMTNV